MTPKTQTDAIDRCEMLVQGGQGQCKVIETDAIVFEQPDGSLLERNYCSDHFELAARSDCALLLTENKEEPDDVR